MSAVLERDKRKTAGRRMNALVGKALEDDDAFWNHDTWAEGDVDSGNDSFHESDEDSELAKDEFDSDFNDSESDHDEEDEAAGAQEELELQRQERSNQQKKRGYTDISSKGRPMMPRKRVKGIRRVMGDGVNAGLVLNNPLLAHPPASLLATTTAAGGGQLNSSNFSNKATPSSGAAAAAASTSAAKTTPTVGRKPGRKSLGAGGRSRALPVASARELRGQNPLKRLRETRSTPPTKPPKKSTRTSNSKKLRKRLYGQEELLLEAINETEPENKRWLLSRKRVQDLANRDKDLASLRDRTRGKVTQKFHSRRGCLVTLTFPEMDSVPDILAGKKLPPNKPAQRTCVITDKPARYRDPKTKCYYYDMQAFKEIRRRQQAGESIDQRKNIEEIPPSETAEREGEGETTNEAGETAPAPAATTKLTEAKSPSVEPAATTSTTRMAAAATTSTTPKVEAEPSSKNTSQTDTPASKSSAMTKKSATSKRSVPKKTAAPNGTEHRKNKPTATTTTTASVADPTSKEDGKKGSLVQKDVSGTNTKKRAKPTKKAVKKAIPPVSAPQTKTTETSTSTSIPLQSSTSSTSSVSHGTQPSERNVVDQSMKSTGTDEPASPNGRRLSRRKWKPSKKLLENIATGQHQGEAGGSQPTEAVPDTQTDNGHSKPINVTSTSQTTPSSSSQATASVQSQQCKGVDSNTAINDNGMIPPADRTSKLGTKKQQEPKAEDNNSAAGDAPATAATGKAVPKTTNAENKSTATSTSNATMTQTPKKKKTPSKSPKGKGSVTKGGKQNATNDARKGSSRKGNTKKVVAATGSTKDSVAAGSCNKDSSATIASNHSENSTSTSSKPTTTNASSQTTTTGTVATTTPATTTTTTTPVTQVQSEQVYVIPAEGDNKDPRYVTQSELIMEVISNYTKRQDGNNKGGRSGSSSSDQS